MEISVLQQLSYKDSFKGKIGRDEGRFKILSNNVIEERISIKTSYGVTKTVTYKDIQDISEVTKRGEIQVKETPKSQEKLPSIIHSSLKNMLDRNKASSYEQELINLINAKIKNIWLVGPAGCGKTTITKNVADILKRELYVISCGLGTSASEFLGYKYPERESTPFSELYAKPSIILLDEFTSLDPAVAQISNSALANGFIISTTGRVNRHDDCIIIATSNTFGQGASRQYVSNNQLDASTIDRFVGGTLEMDYSEAYEKNYDLEVYDFILRVRNVIKTNNLRRIASTRMLIEGCKLKSNNMKDWRARLISNWSKSELELLNTMHNPSDNSIKSLNLN